nr:hypothetical protein [Tanacetum cinerariifolium]
MGEPLSPDRMFDFPMDEPEPHPAYDFFVPGRLPRYDGNPNNNNRWIKADVPLLGELGAEADELMVGLGADEVAEPIVEMEEQGFEDEEEVWEVNEEWLMAPVTPPSMPDVPSSSTYKVGGPSTATAEEQSFTLPAPGFPVPLSVIKDLSTRMGNLKYEYGQLVKKVIQVSDDEVADGITIGEIGPCVSAVEGHVQLQTMVSEMNNRESTLMQCILRMDRRLADLGRRPPRPQKNYAMSDKLSPFKMLSFVKLFKLDFSKEESVFIPATDYCASNPTPIDCMERVSCFMVSEHGLFAKASWLHGKHARFIAKASCGALLNETGRATHVFWFWILMSNLVLDDDPPCGTFRPGKTDTVNGFWRSTGEACEIYSSSTTGYSLTIDGGLSDDLGEESTEAGGYHSGQGLLVCAGVSGGSRGKCVDVVEKAEEMGEVVVQNRPTFYNNGDDDDVDYTIAITSVLSTEEPDNSLSMGDEHLDAIPATESDEVIKSSVEDLVSIPSESEEVEKIVIPEDEEIEDDNLREKLLKVNLLIAKIEALRYNPAPSSEFLTKSSSTSPKSVLEETNTFDNSLPEFENFCFYLEEISSGSTTTQSDISLSEYDSFIFDLSNDQCHPTDRSDFTHEEFGNEPAHIISPSEYDCFYFRNFPDP